MLKTFVYAVAAGVCISLGGCAFLSLDNKVLGALFFVVGLFTICTVGLALFTGKVCYIFERKEPAAENKAAITAGDSQAAGSAAAEGVQAADAQAVPDAAAGKAASITLNKALTLDLIPIWLGNLVGCFVTAWLFSLTRIAAPLTEKALGMVDTKLSDGYLSVFVLAIFCNLLIYIAVDGYKNNPHELGKYLALFFGVMVFILCGFEHCVANMFYISIAGMWSGKAFVFIIVNTLGNAVGGWLLPMVKMLRQ